MMETEESEHENETDGPCSFGTAEDSGHSVHEIAAIKEFFAERRHHPRERYPDDQQPINRLSSLRLGPFPNKCVNAGCVPNNSSASIPTPTSNPINSSIGQLGAIMNPTSFQHRPRRRSEIQPKTKRNGVLLNGIWCRQAK